MASASQIANSPVMKPRDLWKFGDAAVLLVYSCIVLWILPYHEKWADEAQAWLIARDLDLGTIWFHESRYEGSPGLWHTILWVAQHVFHARYGALGYIGATFAIAGAAVLIFLAPFPRYIRWPLAFTYVMVYQYAVIARPYTLLPMLAFSAALFFKDIQHPERITLVLFLLALLTAHGTILAGCLGLAYLLEAIKQWRVMDSHLRKKYLVCVTALACTFVFLFLILKPTPDVEVIAQQKALASAPESVQAAFPSVGQKFIAVTSGAFIDFALPSVILLVLFAVWCVWRLKWLSYVLPVGILIAFYISVHGAAHHHGTVFVAAIVGLWIAWPTEREKVDFRGSDRGAFLAVQSLLLVLCAFNIWDSLIVIQREYAYPYSGSADAAQYLKSVGADHGPMFGFLHGVVAVQAYFDHNIFENNRNAFYHHGLPLESAQLNLEELHRVNPQYVVAYSDEPQVMLEKGAPLLIAEGYELVHFSDGYYLYKRGVFEREVYFIFRKKAASADWPDEGVSVGESEETKGKP